MARGAAVAGRIALPTFPTTAPSDAGGEADESDDPITLLLLTRWGPVLAVWTCVERHFAGREPDLLLLLCHPRHATASMAARADEAPRAHLARVSTLLACLLHPAPTGAAFHCLAHTLSTPASLDVADACPRQLRSFWAMDHEERDVWTRGPPTAAAIPTADCADSYGEFWLTGATLLCCGTPVGPPLPRRRQHAGQRRIAALERLQRAQRRAHLALAEWADSLPATRDAEALRRARQLLRSLHAQHDRLRRRVARARILPRALRIADRRRRRPFKIAAAAAATPAARRLTTARARPAGAAGGCLTAAVEACLCAAVCVLALWMVVRAVEACCVPEPEPGPL